MTNLDSILKSRDISLPTKVCLVKAMAFPVVMYGCENWTIKKAEPQGITNIRIFSNFPNIWVLSLFCTPESHPGQHIAFSHFTSFLDSTEIKPVNPKGNQS